MGEMELESKADHAQWVYEEALAYLARIFHNRDYVGVSVGETPYHLANGKISVEEVDCIFASVVGGVGTRLQSDKGYHSSRTANTFAKEFHGNAVQFFAPTMFNDAQIIEGFLKKHPVQEVMALFKKLKTAIMGIGSCSLKDSTLVRCGYISKTDYEQFKQHGAAGDVLLRFPDKNGNDEPFRRFNDRVMELSDKGLVNIENRIGIAIGGEKSKVIPDVIRAKKINILIIDISCIKELLSLVEEGESSC